ncbi:hypothetical protein FIBSPDRAFT_1044193 [Athelia psychrophila]|uniref:Uncharacterized protein n=1 Tax=Athelia psychrophila TaxID=1759441 RepID=A0A166K2Y1_9AGAM|nr:hypothetical protein FIBSPDRAFT_1044193 [Fibularhizoctonia sp. CBS 109695]
MPTGAPVIGRSVRVSTLVDHSFWPGTCDIGRGGGCEFRTPWAASCAPDPFLLSLLPFVPPRLATPAHTPKPDPLLNLRPEGIKAFSRYIHVNARLISDKSHLVEKVVTLAGAGRSQQKRKARVDEEEKRQMHRAADERRASERVDASAQFGEVEPDPEFSDSGHRMDVD